MNPQQLLQNASSHLAAQNYKQAIIQAKNVLRNDPDSSHALFIYGIANAHLKNQEIALGTFKQLVSTNPNNSEIHYNYGIILSMFGNHEQAIEGYKKATELNPNHVFALINLGNIHNTNKSYEAATHYYQRALSIDPHNHGLRLNLCKSHFNLRNYTACLSQIHNLQQSTTPSLETMLLAVQCYIQLGNYRKAIELTSNIIHTAPKSAEAHYYHGLSSLKMSRYPVAIKSFKTALHIHPMSVDTLMNLAISYSYTSQHAKAKNLIKQLKSIQPDDIGIDVFELTLMEMNNKLQIDNPSLQKLSLEFPQNEELNLLRCKALMSSKNYISAIESLSTLSQSAEKTIQIESLFRLADCYDKTKNFDKAWSTAQQANSLLDVQKTDLFNQKLLNLTGQLKTLDNLKPAIQINQSPKKLIFIIGFPRSGTTLIDSILSSQGKTTLLDETQLLADIADQVINKYKFDNYIDGILSLSESEIADLRTTYFNRIKEYALVEENDLIIDKSPLNIIHTLLIHTLFPDAAIIMAKRHPLDVCISCFMQNFRANPELMHALSSEHSIAETYHNVMQIWDSMATQINLNAKTVQYEQLVTETKSEIKSLIEFAGLRWNEQYLNFNQQKSAQRMIHNPSYNQVNQSIYANKKFRYINYLTHLDIFVAEISQWIDKLGYTK